MGIEGRLMVSLTSSLPTHTVINNDSIVQERYWNGFIILALKLVLPFRKQVITQMVLDKVKTTTPLPTSMWIFPYFSKEIKT